MSSTASGGGNALWSAQAHMPSVIGQQLTIAEGEGSYVTTTDGRTLFDGTAGLWHANIGHGRTEMADAARDQMMVLETYHVFGRFLNNRAVELAERLARLAPFDGAKVILNSGGSDSVDQACKLARRHWQAAGKAGKKTILSREFSYHGLHAFGTSIAGLEFNREGYGTDSLVPETARISVHDIDAVEREIQRIGADNIAAIITEPVLGTGGVIPPADGYFEGLQRLARDNDILLIVDEVITGFGRTGTMFASERYNLEADIVVMAKGITSGYAALGGLLVSPRVWEPFYAGENSPVFRHGVTYSGHATSCAVAMENLDILEREQLVERAGQLEVVLTRELSELGRHELVTETRVGGFLGGIVLDEQISADRVTESLVDYGVIARPLRGNTVQLSPPFVATDAEIEQVFSAIRAVLDSEPVAGL